MGFLAFNEELFLSYSQFNLKPIKPYHSSRRILFTALRQPLVNGSAGNYKDKDLKKEERSHFPED